MSFPPLSGKDEKRRPPSLATAGPGPLSSGSAGNPMPTALERDLAAALATIPGLTYFGGGSADFHRLRWELGRAEEAVAQRARELARRLSLLNTAKEHERLNEKFGDGDSEGLIKQIKLEMASLSPKLEALQEPIAALLNAERNVLKPLRVALTTFMDQRMDCALEDINDNGWVYVLAHRFKRASDYLLLRAAGFSQHTTTRRLVQRYEDDFSMQGDSCGICKPVDDPYHTYLFERDDTPSLPHKPAWDAPATRRQFADIPLRLSGYGRHCLDNEALFSDYHRQARESRLLHLFTTEIRFSMEAMASIWPLPDWPAFMDAYMMPERRLARGPRQEVDAEASACSSSSSPHPASPHAEIPAVTATMHDPLFSLQRRCLIQLDLLHFRRLFDRILREVAARPATPMVLVNVLSSVQHSGTTATLAWSLKSTSSMVLDFARGQEAIYLDNLGIVRPRMKGKLTACSRAETLPDRDHSHMMWLFMLILTLLGAREIRVFGMQRTDIPCEVYNPHDPLASPWWTEPEAPAGPGPGSPRVPKRKREEGDH